MIFDIIKNIQRNNISQYEECGLLASDGEIFYITNRSDHPVSNFVMDRAEFFRAKSIILDTNRTIAAIWHTHPSNDTTASKADIDSVKRTRIPHLIITRNSYKLLEVQDV